MADGADIETPPLGSLDAHQGGTFPFGLRIGLDEGYRASGAPPPPKEPDG